MQNWEQTYRLAAGGRIQIEQRQDAVRVTGWDEQVVKVTAISANGGEPSERLTVSQDGGGLTLEVHPPRGRLLGFIGLGDEALHLELKVPHGTPLQIEAGSGPIDVTATRAPVRIETGSGNVQILPGAASDSLAQTMRKVNEDAALANSEQMRRILLMVEEGKLTVEAAEALLRALDEEESA